MFERLSSGRRSGWKGSLWAALLATVALSPAAIAASSQPAAAHGGDHVHDLFLEALPADNGAVIELAATVVGSGNPADDFSLDYFRYRAAAGVECHARYSDLAASSWQELGLTEAEWGLQRDIFRTGSITVFESGVEDGGLDLHRHAHTFAEPLSGLEAGDLQPFAGGEARLQFCFLLFNADRSRSFNLDFNLWVTDVNAADQPEDTGEQPPAEEEDEGQPRESGPAEPETAAADVREEGGTEAGDSGSAAIWIAIVGGSLFLVVVVATVAAVIAGARNPGSGPTA